jgi:hypothetical protein
LRTGRTKRKKGIKPRAAREQEEEMGRERMKKMYVRE